MCNEKVCSICLDEITTQFTSTLDCGHIFHSNCINTYIIKSKNDKCLCPNCRKSIINTEETEEDDEDVWEDVEIEDEVNPFYNSCYFENTEKHCESCNQRHTYKEWYDMFKDFLPRLISFNVFKRATQRMIRNFKVNKRCYACGGYNCEELCDKWNTIDETDLCDFDKNILELLNNYGITNNIIYIQDGLDELNL